MIAEKRQTRIEKVKSSVVSELPKLIPDDLQKVILFGSCARGDNTDESDVDIAVLVNCGRNDISEYTESLVSFSAALDLENMVVVNFICIPMAEFEDKKRYYPFYMNVEKEGKVIYG